MCDVQRGRVILAAPATRNEPAWKSRAWEAADAAVTRGQLHRRDILLGNAFPARSCTHSRSWCSQRGTGCGAAHMRVLGRKLLILKGISDTFLGLFIIIFHYIKHSFWGLGWFFFFFYLKFSPFPAPFPPQAKKRDDAIANQQANFCPNFFFFFLRKTVITHTGRSRRDNIPLLG